MEEKDYLSWLSQCTPTTWWHDSADPDELDDALSRGAVGVTTNPILIPQALKSHTDRWKEEIGKAVSGAHDAGARAESLMRIVVTAAAERLVPIHGRSSGESGYVCAQVDPSLAGDRKGMYEMGRRYASWASNIAVKLPATAAGLDVLEKLCAEGITVTATVSFSFAQVMAVAERYERALNGRAAGAKAAKCFAVLMIGRLDDYLREIVCDAEATISETDLQQAGLAVAKRACAIYTKKGYRAKLMIAAFRQTHQVAALCGADAVLSIHPKIQKLLLHGSLPRERRMGNDILPEIVDRLSGETEFLRSFRIDGLTTGQFLSYGLTQRTLAQFYESGWKLLESFDVARPGT
jgi:transaldolase